MNCRKQNSNIDSPIRMIMMMMIRTVTNSACRCAIFDFVASQPTMLCRCATSIVQCSVQTISADDIEFIIKRLNVLRVDNSSANNNNNKNSSIENNNKDQNMSACKNTVAGSFVFVFVFIFISSPQIGLRQTHWAMSVVALYFPFHFTRVLLSSHMSNAFERTKVSLFVCFRANEEKRKRKLNKRKMRSSQWH